jgi:hypothetical protein
MADEQTTDTTVPAETVEQTSDEQSSADDKRFSTADVERIVRDRLARESRKSAPRSESKSESRTESRNSKAETGTGWTWDHEDALNALVDEEGLKLSPGLKKRMRSDFAISKPEDLTTWAKGWFGDTGIKQAAATKPNNNVTQQSEKAPPPEPKRTGPALSDKGSATTGHRDADTALENMSELTQGDIARIHAKYGFEKGNQMIAEAATRMMHTVRPVPDRRR